MMVDNFDKLKKASEKYILNDTYNLTENILEYIENRIVSNEQEIRELIEVKKHTNESEISFEEILQIIKEEKEKDRRYKNYSKLKINEQKFLSSSIKMPIGVIAVEAFDTKEVIKYYIKAITTRNAIAISDVEYAEDNVKSLILLIIKEALNKFEIDENLVMLLPYDECFYEYFDEVIYTYDKQGNLLEIPNIDKKEYSNKLYVYLEDASLETEAAKNKNAEIITGEFEEVMQKINRAQGATIYTRKGEIAYKFVNLAHCKNVFVNTNLENMQNPQIIDDMFFEYRNIIIPIPQEQVAVEKIDIEQKQDESKTEQVVQSNEDIWITVKKESIFEKIKAFLRKLF